MSDPPLILTPQSTCTSNPTPNLYKALMDKPKTECLTSLLSAQLRVSRAWVGNIIYIIKFGSEMINGAPYKHNTRG